MARLFFLGGKRASQFRADAKRRKEIRRDASTVDDLCAFAIRLGEEPRHFLVGGDGLEGVVLTLPVEEVGIGSLEGPAGVEFVSGRARGKLDGVDRDQAFVIGKRQGAQENSVDQGEDGCGSSYSESQSDDRRHGESGAAAELAEGELRVGHERGEHGGDYGRTNSLGIGLFSDFCGKGFNQDALPLGSVEVPFSQRQRAVGQSAGTRALSLCSGRGADEGVRPYTTALLSSGKRRGPSCSSISCTVGRLSANSCRCKCHTSL